MELISKTVKIKWHNRSKAWYESKGYIYTKKGDEFEVKVEDLSNGSHVYINIECNECGKVLKNIKYKDYKTHLKDDNKYYCKKCVSNLFSKEKANKTKLLNRKSFYDWCIENNRGDLLDRWDYKLNKCSPKDILFSSNKKFYFKCQRGIHKSELKNINHLNKRIDSGLSCNICNSIGQYISDTYGENGLQDYWDYEKNDKLRINPFEINKGSSKIKVWIKCQNLNKKNYHGSYFVSCGNFTTNNHRCPYCSNNKVHPLDSLGQYIIDNYGQDFLDKVWSEKNKKSSFEYSPHGDKKAWFKCLDKKHKDYYRYTKSGSRFEFRCPECQFSKGEKRIEDYLTNNNLKRDENYMPQKEFDGLLGIGGKNLSYDFYLFQYNILIEYQGEQHEKYIKGFHKSKRDFEKQKEHDRRKAYYAEKNKIKLLPIWYWDFDNIEKILDRELNINKFKEVI